MDNIKVGDMVWAKMIGFPPWPCVVVKSIPNIPKPSNDPTKKYFWVYFFGTNNYAWIPKKRISLFEENRHKFTQPQRNILFEEAVEEAENHYRLKKNNPKYKIVVQKQCNSKLFNKKTKNGNIKQKKIKTANSHMKHNILLRNVEVNTHNLMTSQLVFGVLGAGIIGREIIKNLVRSGHMVNIWNRTSSKCDIIINELGKQYKKTVRSYFSPRSLLEKSDIVFVCLSNQEVVRNILHNSFGINDHSDSVLLNKRIILMTTVGPEASKDLNAVIEKKGGKYLEAQIQGSKTEALEGNLLILAAGDKEIFLECQSCFKSIGKTAMFLGEVGYASKLNLILQLIKGVSLAALSEALALVDRCGLSIRGFLDVFTTCPLYSPYLSSKADKIIVNDYTNVDQSLKNFQRDLKLGLELSNNATQSMFLSSIANEMFKHCKRLEYSDRDAAVVFMRNKH
ncbi:cytokine-like nuclear factor N-PAC [Diorhabda sublineata]|uniref:cytokine-like nuclear factor N-PAC n=1 Tax=Diorhabda sublineata TaxID=1163346 RepID=UPI0024E09A91|nr:cytokine-like nuclear factor N-PAC [Diorhabda sublineata]